ncbi:MAG: TIM barrel protein, partial [bacterium]|nr:TIM barrel protein [bacterium]
ADIRQEIISKITAGAEIAEGLGAHYFLIRPGSLNPEGSWTPHRDNFTPESWQRLVATLKEIVPALEANDVTAVMETHLVSILKNPETCRQLIDTVDSTRLRLVMDYVNHFETLGQVYSSAERLDHIFDQMGPYAPVMHIKDILVGKGLVLHLHETLPGNGELDLLHCFQQFENRFPDQFGLIEHLKRDQIPEAAANTRQICSDAKVSIQP